MAEILVLCNTCSGELSVDFRTTSAFNGQATLDVDPCETCLEKARDTGYKEGYDVGHDHGYNKGRTDNL